MQKPSCQQWLSIKGNARLLGMKPSERGGALQERGETRDGDLGIPGGSGGGGTRMQGSEAALWMLSGNAMSNTRMALVQLRNQRVRRGGTAQRRPF